MSTNESTKLQAKGGVAVLCFLLIILGQVYLLRNVLFHTPFTAWGAVYYLEIVFGLLLLLGIIVCFLRPEGWGRKTGTGIALGLFVLYALVTILNYETWKAAYLTGFQAQFDSAGGALVGLKLVLALIGVTAGIPVAPKIDDREYSRRLLEKVQKQEAEWAKASVQGAQKDLNDTINKLKATLSEEEMAELLKQLQDTASEAQKSPSEEWRGWGGGM